MKEAPPLTLRAKLTANIFMFVVGATFAGLAFHSGGWQLLLGIFLLVLGAFRLGSDLGELP